MSELNKGPMPVEVMRSHLGRARGMGAAKSGVLGAPQARVHRFMASPVNTTLMLAMVAMTFHHMQLGLQVIMEDYIDSQKWQAVAILANKALALLLGLLCAVSILRMAFAA